MIILIFLRQLLRFNFIFNLNNIVDIKYLKIVKFYNSIAFKR